MTSKRLRFFFHSPLLVCLKGCLHVSMCMCTSNHPLPVQTRKKIALTAFATALVTTQKQHSTVSRAQPRHKRNSKTQTIRLSAVKNGWGCDFYFRLFGFFYPNVWPWPVSSCVVIRLWLPSSAFSFRVEPISILPVRCYFFFWGVCVLKYHTYTRPFAKPILSYPLGPVSRTVWQHSFRQIPRKPCSTLLLRFASFASINIATTPALHNTLFPSLGSCLGSVSVCDTQKYAITRHSSFFLFVFSDWKENTNPKQPKNRKPNQKTINIRANIFQCHTASSPVSSANIAPLLSPCPFLPATVTMEISAQPGATPKTPAKKSLFLKWIKSFSVWSRPVRLRKELNIDPEVRSRWRLQGAGVLFF